MKLLKWLSVTDRFAKTYLDTKLAPLGINSSQHMYLLKLCDQPGILQDSLLEYFYVHPSNIVRTISTLEKKGFLTREAYEQDRRTWRLYPTEKALAAIDQIRAACEETEAVLMADFSSSEQDFFQDALFRAGKQIVKKISIDRMEDEFDE